MKFTLASLLLYIAAATGTAADFRAVELTRGGEQICVLQENDSGAIAEFRPDSGGLCYRLRLAAGGATHELFPEFGPERFQENPGSQGMPLLFPFLSIVPEARYTFAGKHGELLPAKRTTHNFHGFAPRSRWRVTRLEAGPESAMLEMELTPAGVPDAARQYPFDFQLTARFTLTQSQLRVDFTVKNPGAEPLPFSIGVHPFFRLPLGAGSDPANCRFRLAARSYWRGENLWRRAEWLPVTPENDPRSGLRPVSGACEHYTDFPVIAGWSEAVYSDGDAGLQVVMRARREFNCVVFYAPADQPGAAAIEAYSAIPNAINLHAAGRRDTGLTVLPPGERFESAVEIQLQNMKENTR